MKKLLLLFTMLVGIASASFADTWTSTIDNDTKNTYLSPFNASSNTTVPTTWTTTSNGLEASWSMSYEWGEASKVYIGASKNGLQIGSKKSPIKKVTLTTDKISGTITSVTVNATSENSTLTTTVGGTAYTPESATLTGSAADYTFTGSAEGEIVIEFDASTSGKNIVIKSITVEYSTGSVSEDLGEIIAKAGTEPITDGDEIEIYNNTDLTFSAANAENITVEPASLGESTFDATTHTATLTPALCSDATVTVTATKGEDTKTLTFSLTVKEVKLSQWTAVASTAELTDGDIITFTADAATGKPNGQQTEVTYPSLVMESLNKSGLILGQEYTYDEPTKTFTGAAPLEITLCKSKTTEGKWVLKLGDLFVVAADKKINTSDQESNATDLEIDINADKQALITTELGKDTYSLQYNPNYKNPVEVSSARFTFYKSKQKPVYMYKKVVETTGVTSVATEEGEAVYYNMQGIRVNKPATGLYIRVINGKAQKVLMK